MIITNNKTCNIAINDKTILTLSAKEMFEELGYVYQESYFEETIDEIYYTKGGEYTPQITFDLNHKGILVYRQENKLSWFDKKILQAINKQVEELGW